MTRAEQKEKRRMEILEAGLDLFIHKGYAATKISDIAKAVDMSVGLLFHYFESKEKLYEELIKLGISGPQGVLSEIKKGSLEFFETSAKEIFQIMKKEPFVAKMFVLMTQAQYNDAAPEQVKLMLSKMDVMTPSVLKIIEGQKDGTIKYGDPVALAVAFWGAITGIAEEIALIPNTPYPDSDWIVDILRKNG